MLSKGFFTLLEYKLTEALAESEDEDLRRCWCDGVLDAEWAEEYLPHYVRKSKVIVLRAWIEGSNHKMLINQMHPLHLHLGRLSFRAYLRGEDLVQWIVEGIDPTQVTVDEREAFHIQLP
ncbi:hypothetical protein [Hymenobacter fodinae]|uniref:Uncharacterized protein n=1 Tax=Hymenobacter fodinae TaxID=2510796 RepID=A0A4Z0PC99_9BACT|nr:hypothetical protein [Hymenobacter fodinae]TGE10276.1 hypothetical protein EU556_05505 [Hymenobacter fodinae]